MCNKALWLGLRLYPGATCLNLRKEGEEQWKMSSVSVGVPVAIIDELTDACRALAKLIMEIENVDYFKNETMAFLETHTQHCAKVASEIKAAFETMAEENAKLRQTLDELEADIYLIARQARTGRL